ncbi:MAG: hypothetical protein ACREP7_15750 [Lysobacter sp.]
MDFAALSRNIDEEIGSRLIGIRRQGDDDLVVTLEFEDSALNGRTRQVELRCHLVVESNCQIGWVGLIDCHSRHPLLLKHHEPHSQLFFSSAPASAGEVYLAAHASIASVLQGWRHPASVLCSPPERFESLLSSGNGVLAYGPDTVIQALAKALDGMLQINAVPTQVFGERTQRQAVILGEYWVVCDSVDVLELPH